MYLFEAAGVARRAEVSVDPERKDKARVGYDSANRTYDATMTIYWQVQEIARLVFSDTVFQRVKNVKQGFEALTAEMIAEGGVSLKFNDLFDELQDKQKALAESMRAELEI